MLKRMRSIKFLYQLSLAEGEGVGTAYEYFAKAAKLGKFLKSVGRPRKILIAGLPEKYGFSMDFFMLSEEVQADVLAIDDRSERIQQAQAIIRDLSSKGLLSGSRIQFSTVAELGKLGRNESQEEEFDLGLSCEVLQRLGSLREHYLKNLCSASNNIAIFAPNRGNSSHAQLSGLQSLSLEELKLICRKEQNKMRLKYSGYLDMPPFPPGITRSQEKRERAADGLLEGLLMKVLEGYCSVERIWPESVKEKMAHIVFVMAGR